MKVRLILIVLLVFWGSFVRAFEGEDGPRISILITKGVESAIPVAVVPFSWQGKNALPEDVSGIVSSDLYRSGYFDLLPVGQMLSLPNKSENFIFSDWERTNQDFVLIGQIGFDATKSQYQVRFELFDIFLGQSVLAEVVPGKEEQLRDIAHYISDKVYEKITGKPGAFSTEIAYVTVENVKTDPVYQLNIADADGGRARYVLRSDEPIISPSWSNDGKKLAYVSFERRKGQKLGRPAIYIQYKETGKRVRVSSFEGLNGAPSWSPDDQKLAFVLSRDGNPEIYVLDLNTKKLSRKTRHYAIDTEPSWTPDGKGIIFTSNRIGNPQIYRLDLATDKVERLTYTGDYNARAQMTRDGRYLVMVHRSEGIFHIARQDLQTGRIKVLTESDLDESPSVAPNGGMVIYATKYRDQGVLSVVSIDGEVSMRLPSSKGDVREPAWSPYLRR
ncbi:Tol-Pal system beta propeller repeat protein TolB [Litoribrevibacter albus]|uniref:Tol-Pal system protein TolB n=1 Tax=Litoribrevibacter albus TaxID=1473156 RepID=A0AA37W5K0_9GAMM|nr:Tol-Pal system beta propeller repeat protein TolB [Litoribrevibacter albus]GLQ31242.1 protein TolB [Litoribrevibacter albus]